MTADIDLTGFWEELETNFPLAGPRKYLYESLGQNLVQLLEQSKLLSFIRIGETYPCPHPGGTNCPRQIIHQDNGTIVAICGNDPPECENLILTEKDIEVIGIEPEALCKALREPLLFGGKFEKLSSLDHVYTAGTYIPEPGIHHVIYFAVRSSPRGYAVVFEALRSINAKDGFAVLIPTDRFVKGDTKRQMSSLGNQIIPLQGTVEIDFLGKLTSKIDPEDLLRKIGKCQEKAFVEVRIREGWKQLTEDEYSRLVNQSKKYDILADELTRTVYKKEKGRASKRENIQAIFFKIIREALDNPGPFDPTIASSMEDFSSAKQLFQRARKALDSKRKGADGRENWCLFKTVVSDKHAVYQFQPSPNIQFALIFLPSSKKS